MMESFTTGSFSTYRTEFSAILIQTDAVLISDIFDITVEFGWLSNDFARTNAAFLKIKFFLENIMHQSVMTHQDAPVNMSNIDNQVIMLPHPPSNDIIAMILHSKLNAIVADQIEVIAVIVKSKSHEPTISYTHVDMTYPALPTLTEWVKCDKYYYDAPWWGRNSCDTKDFEVNADTDLTIMPACDTVLEDLENAIMGELTLEKKGGEIVDIARWKPEIITD